jgi:hypothetical protein
MTEGERAKKRPERRRCPHPGKQPAHPAVTQQRHVIDRIGAGDHPRDQAADLHIGVDTDRLIHPHMRRHQRMEIRSLGERQHRRKPGTGHEIRVIENRTDSMRNSHLRDALLLR